MSSRIGNTVNRAANHLLQSNENHPQQSPLPQLPNAQLANKAITNPAEQISLKTGISTDALRSEITAKFSPQPVPAPAPTPINTPPSSEPSALEKIWQTVEQTASVVKDTTVAIGAEVIARSEDAGRQFGTGLVEAEKGSVMDVAEGLEHIGSGIENTLTGAVEIGISKPLDEHDTLLSEGWNHLQQGIGEIGFGAYQATAGNVIDNALLMIGGRTVSAIQTVTGLEQKGRGLDPAEKAELQKVYGNSIDYDSIKIKEGYAGVANNPADRAFTHGNTIYMKATKPDVNDPIYKTDPNRNYQADLSKWQSTLTHELCHVWQGQHGGTDYMTKAIYAQEFGNGYKYEKGIKEGRKWKELNPEQQAQLIQDAHGQGFFNNPNQKFIVVDDNGNARDETAYLNAALQNINSGEGAP